MNGMNVATARLGSPIMLFRGVSKGGQGGAIAPPLFGKIDGAALWARIAQNVKKPSLTVNVIDLEFFGFNVSIWVP